MTIKLIIENLPCLLRVGVVLVAATGATVASAWSSKLTLLSDDVHCKAIDRALSHVPEKQRALLKQAQAFADTHQAAKESDEHAMTGIETDKDVEDDQRRVYVDRSEAYLRSWIPEARKLADAGDMAKAMLTLGRAVHLLQDATSAPHRPFKVWSFAFRWFEKAKHVSVELSYPEEPLVVAELECATRWAYEIFAGKRAMPAKFFRADHQLEFPAACVKA